MKYINKPYLRYNYPKLDIDQEKYNNYPFSTTKDKQLGDRPKKLGFCKKCLMSNQRPRTPFDENGVCGACRFADMKFNGGIDWEQREKELRALCDKHRSTDGSWDCIVPSSGGKDSVYVAHQLKHKYGMHPLTITWAPFSYKDAGFENYANMVQAGFDAITVWPDGKLHRKLSRVAFELKGDPFEPFVYGQKSLAFHLALKFKIPLIFYGENGEVEYGGSFKNANKPFEDPTDWEEFYFKGCGVDTLLEEGHKMGIFSEHELKNNKFEFYKPPSLDKVKELGVQMHWWSYYELWVPEEHVYYVNKLTGFRPDIDRQEGTYSRCRSIDDRTDVFHWYLAFIKFGYGRAQREACSDIHCGHITREEGVALTQRYDQEFPKKYFEEFLEFLGITEEHFWKVIDKYRDPVVWKKGDDGVWRRREIVDYEGTRVPEDI